jgi:rare lipoprotein A
MIKSATRRAIMACVLCAAVVAPPAAWARDDLAGLDAEYGYGAPAAPSPRAAIDLRPQAPTGAPRLQRALALRKTAAEPVPATETAAPPSRPDWLEAEQVEAPYQAQGAWFVPTAEPGYSETGMASWYGAELAGRRTASGEPFDPNGMTAAHPTLPLQSLIQVTHLATGAEVILRINDRGPFAGGRILDVSRRAAEVLGFERAGQGRVHVRYLGPAPRRVDGQGRTAPRASQEPPPPAPAAAPRSSPRTSDPEVRFAQSGDLFVQIGAFSSAANATRAQAAAGAAGPGRIETERRAGAALHVVRLGPWPSRAAAEAARSRAADAGFRDAVIIAR